VGSIYQHPQQEEKILVRGLNEAMKEGNIRPFSSTVGSPIDSYLNLIVEDYGYVWIADI
jgi:hypothetical protein